VVTDRRYRQWCGLARALDVLGERWALLIVRDLLLGPKRYGELDKGLPGVPSNVLTARLRELEDAGVIRRTAAPRPATGTLYELTDEGRELEQILLRLGLWGSRYLAPPLPGEMTTPDSMAAALRAMFRPEVAAGVSATFALTILQRASEELGPLRTDLDRVEVSARVAGRRITVATGPAANADLTITAEPAALLAILAGQQPPTKVRIEGDRSLLEVFGRLFRPATTP